MNPFPGSEVKPNLKWTFNVIFVFVENVFFSSLVISLCQLVPNERWKLQHLLTKIRLLLNLQLSFTHLKNSHTSNKPRTNWNI